MGRLRHGVPTATLLLVIAASSGCGGGSPSAVPPPPPVPDFSISLSPNSISIADGAANSVNVAANPLNGFVGSVQVTLSGLPAGVVSNPSSPFAVTPGGGTAVVLGAANAPAGNFTISVQGTSGALSHSASLALAV